jgi:hypothetical protein
MPLQIAIDPLVLFQDVGLEPPSQQLISLIDGTKTVEEIFKQSALPAFETLKCLYFLIAVGLVETRTVEETIEIKTAELPLTSEEQPLSPPPEPAAINLEEEIQVSAKKRS